MKVVMRPVSELEPYARNARRHSPDQIQAIAASIEEFGFNSPILTRGNLILAGHGRLAAAQLRNMDKVPTIDLSHLSEAEARLYTISDNKAALNSEWDLPALAVELTELADEEFELTLTGFTQDDIDSILAEGPNNGILSEKFLVPPFSVIDTQSDWWVERDEAWRLGGVQHGAAFGPDAMVFSPTFFELLIRWFSPAGGLVSPDTAAFSKVARACGRIPAADEPLDLAVLRDVREVWALKQDRFLAYVTAGAGHTWRPVIDALSERGLTYYNELVFMCDSGMPEDAIVEEHAQTGALVRAHVTALIFVKGDPKAACAACGDVATPHE